MANKKIKKLSIVCLGGGIGTSNLIRGLKKYNFHLTVITSMADDGGSSGRLRREYNIMPPGDMISCIAAFVSDKNKELSQLLTYRFPGKNLNNKTLDGHKLGNLIMLAEILRTKDIYKALEAIKKMFGVKADILPATDVRTHLSGITYDNKLIHGETALDIPRHQGQYRLKKIYITPKNPKVNPLVLESIKFADVIISGPGDLFTNQLPVLIVPKIKKLLLKRNCRKFFVLNIANKPYETKSFTLSDYVNATVDHLGIFPFDTIIANSFTNSSILKKYINYKFVQIDKKTILGKKIILDDLLDSDFPIYHDSKKLAKIIVKNI